jgi:oligogalacturonide lyase
VAYNTNLFRYDLDSGTITQITDLAERQSRLLGCVSEVNQEVYFWTKTHLLAVDLDTYAERVIVEVDPAMPPSLTKSRAGPTADGKYIVAQLMEELPQEQASVSFAYARFREYYEKRPLSQIVRIEIDTGKHATGTAAGDTRGPALPGARQRLAHAAGPAHFLPRGAVELGRLPTLRGARIWGLNIQTGERWKVHPQEGDYSVGHEYWFADGVHVGYHGRPRDGSGRHVFGHIK